MLHIALLPSALYKTFVVTNTNQPPAVICAHAYAFNVGLLYFGTGHVTAMAQAPGTLLITPAGCHLRAVIFRGIQALVGSTARTPSGLNGRTVSATGVQWLGSASALHSPVCSASAVPCCQPPDENQCLWKKKLVPRNSGALWRGEAQAKKVRRENLQSEFSTTK